MTAIRFHSHGGPEIHRLHGNSVPVSQPGGALLRVRTAGVNYADIHQRTDVTPPTV